MSGPGTQVDQTRAIFISPDCFTMQLILGSETEFLKCDLLAQNRR